MANDNLTNERLMEIRALNYILKFKAKQILSKNKMNTYAAKKLRCHF